MIIDTKYFGTIDIGEEKIIHFDNGLLGFEEYKDYTILYDIDESHYFHGSSLWMKRDSLFR